MTESVQPFLWRGTDKEFFIHDLKGLLDVLTSMQQEDIDQEIGGNIKGLAEWIATSFPQELILISSIKKALTEFTSQQMREMLIRELGTAVTSIS